MDDLDEIHFTMKKARQVIRDIARGIATDKCFMALLLLIVLGIVAIIVLNVVGVNTAVSLPGVSA
jgi:SNARE protein